MKYLSTAFLVFTLLVLSAISCHKYETETFELPASYDEVIYHPTNSLSIFVPEGVQSNVFEVQEIYSSVTGLEVRTTTDSITADVILNKTEVDTMQKMLREKDYIKLSKSVERKLHK